MFSTPPPDSVTPCVSFREFWTVEYPLTKREVEDAWGVKGKFLMADGRTIEYRYPRCGKTGADIMGEYTPHVTVWYTFRTPRVNEYMEWM